MNIRTPHLNLIVIAIFFLTCTQVGWAEDSDIEETICGAIKERAAFQAWSLAAGEPDQEKWKASKEVEKVSFKTRDGRELFGYKINGISGKPLSGSCILIAQGNAMLADQILDEFLHFRTDGADVFIYDYRGYGESTGNRRLKAILSDYKEIYAKLTTEYKSVNLYGISFGGIVLLNTVTGSDNYKKMVIDSTPSRISNHGCPENVDPVNNLPSDSSRILLISGDKDRVVPSKDTEELLNVARSKGATVIQSKEFAHPFMDNVDVRLKRRLVINDYFLN